MEKCLFAIIVQSCPTQNCWGVMPLEILDSRKCVSATSTPILQKKLNGRSMLKTTNQPKTSLKDCLSLRQLELTVSLIKSNKHQRRAFQTPKPLPFWFKKHGDRLPWNCLMMLSRRTFLHVLLTKTDVGQNMNPDDFCFKPQKVTV